MADNKKMVEAITSMDEDFAQWYTDVVKKAELCDYASVKGCMVIKRPAMQSGRTSRRKWTEGLRRQGCRTYTCLSSYRRAC
mgnify:CR=1 FL=1